MVDDQDLQDVLDRTCDLAQDRLSDITNYPIINGKIAFFDEEVLYYYEKAHRSRPSDHLIERGMWNINLELKGDKVRCSLTNRKEVPGNRSWNLVDDILSVGTSRYKSMKRMSFFDRYKNKWFFRRSERNGIGREFVSGFNHMVKMEVHKALADAMVEYKQGRL